MSGRDYTYEEHQKFHEKNYVLVVGCPYCKPEIDKTKKSTEQPIHIGVDNHKLTG